MINIYQGVSLKFLAGLIAMGIFATACAPVVEKPLSTVSGIPATDTPLPTATLTLVPSVTPSQTKTPTAPPTEAPTQTPIPTNTETISEMLKSRIVFFLIVPAKGGTDACGDITIEPIISKRYRTGDKVQDVQIALNMVFNMGTRYYGSYYNALWNTDLIINSYEYNAEKDEMIIDFGGFFPVMELSRCDKHGIKEQIWNTFYFYDFKEKIFTYNGKFLIDQLGR